MIMTVLTIVSNRNRSIVYKAVGQIKVIAINETAKSAKDDVIGFFCAGRNRRIDNIAVGECSGAVGIVIVLFCDETACIGG